jgi:hypothetical protein
MRTIEISGAANVARELRALSDRIESSMPGIQMVMSAPEEGQEGTDSTLLEVRFSHPEAQHWHLTELLSALSRPGD